MAPVTWGEACIAGVRTQLFSGHTSLSGSPGGGWWDKASGYHVLNSYYVLGFLPTFPDLTLKTAQEMETVPVLQMGETDT